MVDDKDTILSMSGYRRVNYYELCRLCTSSEGTKMHIFREEGRRRQLPGKIQTCLPLQVSEEDSLPKIVCTNCVEKLESFYDFRESCVNAEAMLESYFTTIRADENGEGEGTSTSGGAAVYVREDSIAGRKKTVEVLDVLNVLKPVKNVDENQPHATTLVVSPDGLTNLMQAGIQIISEPDVSRLQPLRAFLPDQMVSTPTVIEAPDGTRYTYVGSAGPATTQELTVKQGLSESSDEGSQHSQPHPQQAQTITFTSGVPGQEMMVHFNVNKDNENNPQIQRASIAQLEDLLRMNLVDPSTIIRDPSIPGGIRIVPTVLSSHQIQEQQHNLQQQQIQQQELQQHQQLQEHLQQQLQIHHQQQIQLQEQHQQSSTVKKTVKQQHQQEKIVQQEEHQLESATTHQEDSPSPHHSVSLSIEAVVGGAGGTDEEADKNDKGQGCFACPECGKKFKRKEHLCQHQKLHTGERPYVCEHCYKSFSRKEHLMRHAVSHTGSKQYECEQCGKNFSRKDNLHKHKKTHALGGPYTCETCGKHFVVKHYYNMHKASHGAIMKNENGDFVEDPTLFKCDVCHKGFVTEAYLNTHKIRHRKKQTTGDQQEQSPKKQGGRKSQHKKQQTEGGEEEDAEVVEEEEKQEAQPESQQIIQQHVEQIQVQTQDVTLGNNHMITLQAAIPTSNGIQISPAMLPHILQQMMPTSQTPAVIQVQTTAAGTAYICSAGTTELLEQYRRLHSS